MERRKFLIGAGSTVIGASAIVGSGAFDRVSATRTAKVRTVGDAYANLRLYPSSKYAEYNGNGILEIKFDNINANAKNEFFDVFTIQNQGNKQVGIFLDEGSRSYAFQQGNGPAEKSSEAGSDGMYNELANAGFPQNGWFDENNSTEDINGPKALPSAYRASSSNTTNRPSLNSNYDHVLGVGESLKPDWYISDTGDPGNPDITGDLVILAYSQEFVDAGKGP